MSSMKDFTIVIANKRYSSWSMRPWLALRHAAGKNGFNEMVCNLNPAGGGSAESGILDYQEIKKLSPTGKVPALIDHKLGVTLWESIAIIFHIAEKYPDAKLYPDDLAAKGVCIAASCEMHTGFMAMRNNMAMHSLRLARKHGQVALQMPEVQADITRLGQLWTELRTKYGDSGPYLFGRYSIADSMYTPVVLRFKAYDPELTSLAAYPLAQEYIHTIYASEIVQEWIEDAKKEGPPTFLERYEKFMDEE